MKTGKVFAIVFTGLFLMNGCVNKADADSKKKTDTVSGATHSSEFLPGEWTNYNGVALGPMSSFRENSIKGVQYVDASKYTLKFTGMVKSKLSLKYAEVTNLAAVRKLITIYCVEGWSVTVLWQGVPMKTLLKMPGVSGSPKTVIFRAADGYSTSLPLHEVLKKDMILAYSANGIPLPAKNGFPFILVAEDKWGYKWARWITEIELSANTDYKGYWEQRGYNNDASLSGPIFE
jgi:DMSO/TMAO reductase YedYZ molybdopterin-dependent catalytic subunit